MALNTHLNNFLFRIAEEQKYKNSDIKVLPVSTGGANYSSLLYTATISSKGKDDLHLFIKVLVLSEQMKEEIKSYESVTNREKAFYIDIKQAYENLERKYEVPEEHRLWLPKCYGSEVTPSFEALVMENLVVKGFESFDRFKSMDWEYASKAVTELAKLHALSYALQINDPEEFKRVCDKYVNDVMTENIVIPLWSNGVKNALTVLNDDDKRKFEKYANEFTFKKFTEYRETLKFTVIAHGDFRPSNFMHRIVGDDSVEVVVLDHQTFYLGSPIADLLNLIASATDKRFRDQYFDKLIEHYYIQLSNAFRRMDIDPEKTYSREEFYAELKEVVGNKPGPVELPVDCLQQSSASSIVSTKLPYGLVVATFVLPFITVETDQAPELKTDMNIDNMQITQLGTLYPERMRDMVSDFVKWGVLSD